jgi:hypothetical protein
MRHKMFHSVLGRALRSGRGKAAVSKQTHIVVVMIRLLEPHRRLRVVSHECGPGFDPDEAHPLHARVHPQKCHHVVGRLRGFGCGAAPLWGFDVNVAQNCW